MEVGGELQLGQVIQRLRRNGQGGAKEWGGEGKVWLIEANRTKVFTGVMRGKWKGER